MYLSTFLDWLGFGAGTSGLREPGDRAAGHPLTSLTSSPTPSPSPYTPATGPSFLPPGLCSGCVLRSHGSSSHLSSLPCSSRLVWASAAPAPTTSRPSLILSFLFFSDPTLLILPGPHLVLRPGLPISHCVPSMQTLHTPWGLDWGLAKLLGAFPPGQRGTGRRQPLHLCSQLKAAGPGLIC